MIKKILIKFSNWLKALFRKKKYYDFKVVFLEDNPRSIEEKTIYIISDGPKPDTLIFKCPCGCTADIFLNLLTDTRPVWSFEIHAKNEITVSPSIWRQVGCRSHFFIINGNVSWAK